MVLTTCQPTGLVPKNLYSIPKIVSKERLTYKDYPFDLQIEQNNTLREFRIKLSRDVYLVI